MAPLVALCSTLQGLAPAMRTTGDRARLCDGTAQPRTGRLQRRIQAPGPNHCQVSRCPRACQCCLRARLRWHSACTSPGRLPRRPPCPGRPRGWRRTGTAADAPVGEVDARHDRAPRPGNSEQLKAVGTELPWPCEAEVVARTALTRPVRGRGGRGRPPNRVRQAAFRRGCDPGQRHPDAARCHKAPDHTRARKPEQHARAVSRRASGSFGHGLPRPAWRSRAQAAIPKTRPRRVARRPSTAPPSASIARRTQARGECAVHNAP